MANNKPGRYLKIRNVGELDLIIGVLQQSLVGGDIIGPAKSTIDRWLSQLRAVVPAADRSRRPISADQSQKVFDLDGKPHRPTPEVETVRDVFEHWRRTMKKSRARLDSKRHSLIARRLSDGFTPADLKLAIDGCAASPFHQGENDSGTRYCELSLILRDAENVERFCALAESSPRPRSTASSVQATKDARAAWRNVVAHVRAGEHRRGASLGEPTDKAVSLLGGYRAVGMANQQQLFDLERRFVDQYRELASAVVDPARLRPLRTDAERRS